jgi:hypothetical protein
MCFPRLTANAFSALKPISHTNLASLPRCECHSSDYQVQLIRERTLQRYNIRSATPNNSLGRYAQVVGNTRIEIRETARSRNEVTYEKPNDYGARCGDVG